MPLERPPVAFEFDRRHISSRPSIVRQGGSNFGPIRGSADLVLRGSNPGHMMRHGVTLFSALRGRKIRVK